MTTSALEFVAPDARLDTLPAADLHADDGSWNVGYWFAPGVVTLGFHAIAWIEGGHNSLNAAVLATCSARHASFTGLITPNGPRAGRPVRLTQRQKRFLLWWYALDPVTGKWLFHHGVRRLAKGSGKSPFMAMLALFELCGPCRPLRLVDPLHERPWCRAQAHEVRMPWVQLAATTESQTHNTMRMVRAMAAKRSPVAAQYSLDPGKTMIYTQPEGKLEVITSSFTAVEGAEPSFLVADETEHSTPSNGGPELLATLADNAAKSGARMVETCNAWVPGRASVAEDTYTAWRDQEEGLVFNTSAILYDSVKGSPDFEAKLGDREHTRAELERIYADCDWKRPHEAKGGELLPVRSAPPDIDSILGRIYDVRSRPDDSVRKYGNLPTAAEDAWVAQEQWTALAKWREISPDEPVVMFFDGSKSRDATALVGCAMDDGYTFVVKIWERPLSSDGKPVKDWEVPVHAVDLAVRQAHADHEVVAFFGDVREWESYVHTLWPDVLPVEKYLVLARPIGRNAGPIAWDMRGHVAEFTSACELTHNSIETKAFHHDGHPQLLRHVANARNRENAWGRSIGKESPDSPNKIDAAVCAIGAQMVRRLVLASDAWRNRDAPPEQPKRRPGRVRGWD